MKKTILEDARKIPVTNHYDVVVVGGGIAGVAAAVAASRNGAKTCLIEKEFGLGGLATLGNVIIYLPLCDGNGNQVIKGLGEELLKLSIKDGYDKVPDCWKKGGSKEERIKNRYRVDFNPMSYMIELEEFICKNGVKLYYDSRFCGVSKTDGRINAVIIENKDGRSALSCGAVVDATGDADVCWHAGEKTVSWDTNVRAGWFYYFDGKKVQLDKFTKWYNADGSYRPESGRGFAGDKAEDVTDFVLETRKMLKQELAKRKKTNPQLNPLFMTSIPCFRMTRRLKGTVELDASHDKHYFDDCIGMTGDWRNAGPVFYIPLRSLAATKTANLITAGRCMSAGTTGWDIMRVIPTCAVTGEGAGVAAAVLSRQNKKSFADIKIKELQGLLKEQKVLIDSKYAKKS